MRTPIIAGNWKMNKTPEQARALAAGVVEGTAELDGVEVIVGPTAVALPAVAEAVEGTHVGLAAQNMHPEPSGAFTGEVSAPMLREVGCTHVILGHSERRQLFGETDDQVRHKLEVALEHGLTPIVCVGETLDVRKAGRTMDRVGFQVRAAFAALDPEQAARVVLAYEPIWAIGTGETATPAQAQEVHATIRVILAELHDEELARSVRIQYGGSVKPHNIEELIAQPDIDGALVGGASLEAGSFSAIAAAAAAS